MKLSKEKIENIRKRVNEGRYSSSSINMMIRHADACELEMRGYREEIERLRKLVDQHATGEKQAVAAADRLTDEILHLQSKVEHYENLIQQKNKKLAQLQTEFAEAREAKKVPLPREVADAIEICEKAGLGKFGIVTLMERVSSLFRDYSKHVIESLTIIREYVWRNVGGGETFMKALVNGYTVEQPQTFMTSRKLDESEIRAIRNWYQGALKRMEDGYDPDGFAKEAVEEVALYLGGAELLKDMSGFCKTQLEREKVERNG